MISIHEFLLFIHSKLTEPFFYVLLSIICVDVVAGVAVAFYQKSGHSLHGGVESSHFIKGVWRKILNLLLYVVGGCFEYWAGSSAISTVVTTAIIGYEGISLIENFALLGFPFPDKLKKLFEVFKKDGD